jgi:hypothetical protein
MASIAGCLVNNKWDMIMKGTAYCPGIYLEGLRNTTRNLSTVDLWAKI